MINLGSQFHESTATKLICSAYPVGNNEQRFKYFSILSRYDLSAFPVSLIKLIIAIEIIGSLNNLQCMYVYIYILLLLVKCPH